MANTTFIDGQTPIKASWLNDVNTVVYNPAAAVIPASSIINTPNTPAGNIAATNVQTALNELDSEKQPLDATLTALAGTLTAANKIPYATAPDTAGELTLDTDGTLAANSDIKLATQKAVKTAIASAVTFSSQAENIAGTVSSKSVSPLGIREAFNVTGTAPVYACRAWVNFNGTFVGNMTIANGGIRASGNVSSITDNGVGDYTVNFTTAMQDVNYSVAGMAGNTTPTTCSFALNTNTFTTTAFRVSTVNPGVALTDYSTITLSVFR